VLAASTLACVCCIAIYQITLGTSRSDTLARAAEFESWAIAFAILPCAWVLLTVGALARKGIQIRNAPETCACGYSLTGNVSGVCPECGRKLG
jgi:hypothetical protein